MTYKIKEKEFSTIIEENCSSKLIKLDTLGTYEIKKNQINEDIVFFDTNLNLVKKDLIIESHISAFEGLFLNYNINGKFHYKNKYFDYYGKQNHSAIAYINEINGKVSYSEGSHRSLGVFIKEGFLKKNLTNYLNNTIEHNTIFKNESISLQSSLCLRDIINTPYNGNLNMMFIQSKIFELLFYEFSHIINSQKIIKKHKKKTLFSDEDMEALKKAKELLTKEFINPPTIKELSKIVALNEFKIKKGFKYIFHTTPYSIVKSQRMKFAKSLLISSDYNISEVSKAIGYKNQGHFSKAFFDYYQVLPKDLMKKRTYYY